MVGSKNTSWDQDFCDVVERKERAQAEARELRGELHAARVELARTKAALAVARRTLAETADAWMRESATLRADVERFRAILRERKGE